MQPPPPPPPQDLTTDLGDLLYQGAVLVSDSKFGIKAEKERHLFCFDRAVLFTRKVDLPQSSNFKYEFKFKITVSSDCTMGREEAED